MKIDRDLITEPEVLNLEGELTISRSIEILSILKESIHKSNDIRISLRDITGIDLSILQLLCSAHRTSAAMGKTISLESPVPAVFRQTVRQAGFKRRNGCAHSLNTNCLCNYGEE